MAEARTPDDAEHVDDRRPWRSTVWALSTAIATWLLGVFLVQIPFLLLFIPGWAPLGVALMFVPLIIAAIFSAWVTSNATRNEPRALTLGIIAIVLWWAYGIATIALYGGIPTL